MRISVALLLGALVLLLGIVCWLLFGEFVAFWHIVWQLAARAFVYCWSFFLFAARKTFMWAFKRPLWIGVAIFIPAPMRGYYKRLQRYFRALLPEALTRMRSVRFVLSIGATACVMLVGAYFFGTWSVILLFRYAPQVVLAGIAYLFWYIAVLPFRFVAWKSFTRACGRLWERWTPEEFRGAFRAWRRSMLKEALRHKYKAYRRVKKIRIAKKVSGVLEKRRNAVFSSLERRIP